MKGDFTRNTFDPAKHFSSVFMQQGRVMLDADYNEQSAILLHYLRTLARDLIGPYAAPYGNPGFLLKPAGDDGFSIGAGRYYVDGILVENESDCTYTQQPHYRVRSDDQLLKQAQTKSGQLFWAYLDVWERHITWLEDPGIREKALGGPDTCTRSQVIWQVKVLPIEKGRRDREIARLEQERKKLVASLEHIENLLEQHKVLARIDQIDEQIALLRLDSEPRCDTPLADLVTLSKARMAARVDPGHKSKDPCVTSPDSKYRGPENHLYRVEIHRGGNAEEATFKWSRENGSNAVAWVGTDGNHIEVANTRGFTDGGWLELMNDSLDLASEPGTLVKIAKVEDGRLLIDSETVPGTGTPLAWSKQLVNPRVRLWHQAQRGDIVLKDGAVPFTDTSTDADGWIDLEDGIQVRFENAGEYRSGDYWLIPARVATGQLEWPTAIKGGKEVPELMGPKGIEHHYAPLGFMAWDDSKGKKDDKDNDETEWTFRSCRCDFDPLSSCFVRDNGGDPIPPPKKATKQKSARARKKTTR